MRYMYIHVYVNVYICVCIFTYTYRTYIWNLHTWVRILLTCSYFIWADF